MINDQPIISQPENLRLLYAYLKDCIDQPAERAIMVHERNTAWFVITADLAEKGQIGLAIPFVYAITDAELAKHAIQRLIRVATNQQHLPYVQPLLNYAIQLNDRSDRYQAELYLAKLTMDATDPPATQLTATVSTDDASKCSP
ncbi:MAG: hypothetical protein LCH85_00505 [Chloroflexi bacterium]|nr:hypothetical protein [Chloroflexota bacterium]